MKIANDELISILSQFNPWWHGEAISDIPSWHRAAFKELFSWIYNPPTPRAVLLTGARQVGKTTLLRQAIDELLKKNVPPANIIYITFDHPIIKLVGIEAVLKAWREREPKVAGIEYVFLDEAQYLRNWHTWVKHQADFEKNRRIIFTGSATPLLEDTLESGVGRWLTIRLATLSFYEYLKLKQASLKSEQLSQGLSHITLGDVLAKIDNKSLEVNPQQLTLGEVLAKIEHKKIEHPLPQIKSLNDLFAWSPQQFKKVAGSAQAYVGYFHEYLIRSGFPQISQIDNIIQAQRLLREDIIDKVLKRDMTAFFGVRRVLELEQAFLYLCMHDSGLLDMQQLGKNLEVSRQTVQNYIELLEACHLIYKLQPYGYGKEILRGKYKIYLADPAIAPAVLLKGKNLLNDPDALGVATEAAVLKHLYSRLYQQNIRFSYWHGKKKCEVDLIAEVGGQIIPFEVKYRSKNIHSDDLNGLIDLCQKKSIDRGYVITKALDDFGLLSDWPIKNTQIMRIPASLFCYWLGENEISQNQFVSSLL